MGSAIYILVWVTNNTIFKYKFFNKTNSNIFLLFYCLIQNQVVYRNHLSVTVGVNEINLKQKKVNQISFET